MSVAWPCGRSYLGACLSQLTKHTLRSESEFSSFGSRHHRPVTDDASLRQPREVWVGQSEQFGEHAAIVLPECRRRRIDRNRFLTDTIRSDWIRLRPNVGALEHLPRPWLQALLARRP